MKIFGYLLGTASSNMTKMHKKYKKIAIDKKITVSSNHATSLLLLRCELQTTLIYFREL